MKDEQFAQFFALASAYCGLSLAVFLMIGAVTTTGVKTIAFFAQEAPAQAATVVLSDDYGTGVAPADGVFCPHLTSTFQRGARDSTTGGQVSELQAFLTDYYNLDDGLVSGGYYGRLTYKYVTQFQAEQGLPTYGIVGSLTRAAIAHACGGGGTSNATLSATPTSGSAPLNVNFTLVNGTDGIVYSLDFGDGSGSAQIRNGGGVLSNVAHTYTTAGTYQAALTSVGSCSSGMCAQTASVTITVATNACPGAGCPDTPPVTFSATPASGAAPLGVVFVSSTDGTINFGDGTSGEQSCLQLQTYPSQTRCTSNHTYTSAGTYTATLTTVGACSSGMCAQTSSVTITVGGNWNTCPMYDQPPCPAGYHYGPNTTSANGCTISGQCVPDTTNTGTFSATPTSGTAPLSIVFVSNANGTINFGDGTSGSLSPNCATGLDGSGNCNTGSYLATHTYTAAGTYQATVTTVGACSSGMCAQTSSVTVTVSGGNWGGTGLIQNFDPAGMVAAVVAAPFDLMVDSLTNIFVIFGIGQ